MSSGIIIKVNEQSDEELALAKQVEVYERIGEMTQYTLSYPADVQEGDITWLKDKRLEPGSVISILVQVDNNSVCLVKGPVYSQNIHLQHGGEGSSVEVKGADNSIIMNREFKSIVWSNVSDSDAVTSIAGNYSLIPDINSTDSKHLETKHTLVQRETDLRFIRRLARRNGSFFWISYPAPGVERANFKRLQLNNEAAVKVIINLNPPNIQSFDLSWDVERPTSISGKQLDLNTKNDINGDLSQSPQQSLGENSLQAITNDTRSVQLAAPVDDAGDMQARSEAVLMDAEWFIRASCKANLDQLGKLVRAYDLVEVQGAGSRHSGKYLVSGVRHIINSTDHLMEMELMRNGWDG